MSAHVGILGQSPVAVIGLFDDLTVVASTLNAFDMRPDSVTVGSCRGGGAPGR